MFNTAASDSAMVAVSTSGALTPSAEAGDGAPSTSRPGVIEPQRSFDPLQQGRHSRCEPWVADAPLSRRFRKCVLPNVPSVSGPFARPSNHRLHLTAPRGPCLHSGRAESPVVRYWRATGPGSSSLFPDRLVYIWVVLSERDSPRPERTRGAAGEPDAVSPANLGTYD